VGPPLPGDIELSNEWLTTTLQKNKLIDEKTSVIESKIINLDENRGFSGTLKRITIKYNNNSNNANFLQPSSLILKMSKNLTKTRFHCMITNSYREALFYEKLSKNFIKEFNNVCPQVYYTYASPKTGIFVVLMEDLKTATGVNYLFGNQVWGTKALDISIKPEQVLEIMFLKVAEIHAKYWKNQDLLKKIKWLKFVDWREGKNRIG